MGKYLFDYQTAYTLIKKTSLDFSEKYTDRYSSLFDKNPSGLKDYFFRMSWRNYSYSEENISFVQKNEEDYSPNNYYWFLVTYANFLCKNIFGQNKEIEDQRRFRIKFVKYVLNNIDLDCASKDGSNINHHDSAIWDKNEES